MASREQIKQHIAQSITIKIDSLAEPTKGNEAKKLRIMEHVAMSKGKA